MLKLKKIHHEKKFVTLIGKAKYILNATKLLELDTMKDITILKMEPSGLSIYVYAIINIWERSFFFKLKKRTKFNSNKENEKASSDCQGLTKADMAD